MSVTVTDEAGAHVHAWERDGPLLLRCGQCHAVAHWRSNGWGRKVVPYRCRCGATAVTRDHDRKRSYCAKCEEKR